MIFFNSSHAIYAPTNHTVIYANSKSNATSGNLSLYEIKAKKFNERYVSWALWIIRNCHEFGCKMPLPRHIFFFEQLKKVFFKSQFIVISHRR